MEEVPREEEMDAIEPALHLRVLAAILGGQGGETRVEEALALAQEVYALEQENASLEHYRWSTTARPSAVRRHRDASP